MRLFIGIPIHPSTRLSRAGRELQNNYESVRLIPRKNWHITLRFFGEVEQVDPVIEATELALRNVPAFPLSVTGCGAFPGARRARVAWAGIQSDGMHLVEERLRFETKDLGNPPERRPFQPHLTLARIRPEADISDWAEKYRSTVFLHSAVEEIVLYQSELGAKGPVYNPVAVFGLKQSGSSGNA